VPNLALPIALGDRKNGAAAADVKAQSKLPTAQLRDSKGQVLLPVPRKTSEPIETWWAMRKKPARVANYVIDIVRQERRRVNRRCWADIVNEVGTKLDACAEAGLQGVNGGSPRRVRSRP